MEKKIFRTKHNNHEIVGDILSDGIPPELFFMHGAGIANRKVFDSLRQMLTDENISSGALDFVGYGETGGKVEESSLKARTEQAKAIIEKFEVVQPLTIFASSMSGYGAIKLTEIFPVDLLVLFGPAVYRKDAYEVPFGDKFSSLIREPQSWENTDAWDILNKYKGKIIIFVGEKDNVIPFEIIQKIYDSSKQATFKEIIVIPDAPHQLFTKYFKENPNALKMVAEKIITLLK